MTPLLLDAAVSLGSMALAPAFDFLKKKFIPAENDTPERTMGTLATTKPDILPAYVTAIGSHLKAKGEYFNRDVIGTPSQWVIDTRAAIRPITVIICLVIMFFDSFTFYTAAQEIKLFCIANVSNWMGSRLVNK